MGGHKWSTLGGHQGKLTGGGIIGKAARHNRRVIQAELGASGTIDATRSHLNITLMGPSTADEVAQLAKAKVISPYWVLHNQCKSKAEALEFIRFMGWKPGWAFHNKDRFPILK